MSTNPSKIRFVCISDTHNHAPGQGWILPRGDVLIHAGDLGQQGSLKELKKASEWLEKADFAVKIILAGNHDLSLDSSYDNNHEHGHSGTGETVEECRQLLEGITGAVYLQHSSEHITIPDKDGVSFRVFGSPYSAIGAGRRYAFQYSEDTAEKLWSDIPLDTDIVVTHTPPAGYCDESSHWVNGGCPSLLRKISKVKPALHVSGHCHEGRGAQIVRWGDDSTIVQSVTTWEDPGIGNKKQSLLDLTGSRYEPPLELGKETAIVNASIKAKSFRAGSGPKEFNKPIVVDLALPTRGDRCMDFAT